MPSFLVLGCTNFYGRALIEHLCGSRSASDDWEIRGVDKTLPELAGLPAHVQALYSTFDFRMGNLRSDAFLAQAFARTQGTWDYVFNFAAEHKFGLAAQAYDQDVRRLSAAVGRLALQQKAGVLVQLSTAHVFGAKGGRKDEEAKLDPPNALAAAHVQAENDLRALPGLPLVVLRPALCYGPGDRQNIVPMLIAAQLSKAAGEKMPVLWDRDVRVSTVHVADVACAALRCALWHRGAARAVTFNLADPGDTTNAALAQAAAGVFGVEPAFHSAAVNFLARRLKPAELTEEVNESLLGPWMDLLAAHGLANSPLSPYLDQEHPYCRLDCHPLAVDGSRIAGTPDLGFAYAYAGVSTDALRSVVDEFQQLGLWPNVAP